jgi:hypothetical protein
MFKSNYILTVNVEPVDGVLEILNYTLTSTEINNYSFVKKISDSRNREANGSNGHLHIQKWIFYIGVMQERLVQDGDQY